MIVAAFVVDGIALLVALYTLRVARRTRRLLATRVRQVPQQASFDGAPLPGPFDLAGLSVADAFGAPLPQWDRCPRCRAEHTPPYGPCLACGWPDEPDQGMVYGEPLKSEPPPADGQP